MEEGHAVLSRSRIWNVPSDEASFRRLMVAVRYALNWTNAAEPAEDPPIADGSLTPVLEEVFPTGQGRKQVKQRDGLAQPGWLDGQTIAIVSAVLTVGVGIGAMVFASTSSIRSEISGIRSEISGIRGEVDGLATKLEDTRKSLTAEIKATRSELRYEIKAVRSELSAEIKAVRPELSAEIKGLDGRLRNVEQDVAVIKARLPVRHPVIQGASPLDDEEDDVDA